jgi:hypothetical protein
VESGLSSGRTGIRTDRLLSGQLRSWRKIERIVFARDAAGQPLHPTLEGLWRQVESSGHRIFIELGGIGPGNMAGKFVVENLDPEGMSHDLSIRLYLASINGASTKEGARRADGFIPFKGLYREKRHAEALGHEMAHATRTLQDPCYAALVEEQKRLEAELAASSRKSGKIVVDVENQLRMRRLDVLTRLIEEPVNATEIQIWRELARSGPGELAETSLHPANPNLTDR